MSNICDTQYKVRGSRKALSNLWNTLQMMGVNSKDVYLYKLAEHYGIDYEHSCISVRGQIYWAEFEDDEDGGLLSFDTESAWTACDIFFYKLNKVLGNELSISYREIECGCEIFHVHDEGNFFPEECCVSSSGGSFDDVCEDVYDTISDAIKAWVEKTGIVQGERTNEEMVDFINEYVYDTDDTYFIYTHLNLISIHSRGRGFAFPLHNPINYEKTKKKADRKSCLHHSSTISYYHAYQCGV